MQWEYLPFLVPIGIVGASIGSFLNVVVYRVPHKLSLLNPPSHCPKCKTGLGPTENVPILGWLWLRGRCRHCRTPIPFRYPAVEALTMGLFFLCIGVWGFSWPAMGGMILLSWLIPLAIIDLETFLLPEELTRSALLVGLVWRLLLPLLEGQGSVAAIASTAIAGIGAAVLGIFLLEIIGWIGLLVLGKEAMGGGDGKLLAAIGMWLGWQAVLVTVMISCFIGTCGALVLGLVKRRSQWSKPIPFGPYLVLGGMAALFAGPQLVDWYLGLAGL